jgi:hypothetical protein
MNTFGALSRALYLRGRPPQALPAHLRGVLSISYVERTTKHLYLYIRSPAA